MLSGKVLLCAVLVAAWQGAQAASLPFFRLADLGEETNEVNEDIAIIETGDMSTMRIPLDLVRARVREGVPPPLCAGRCASPRAGPVCAFDASGTARTFATLCELEAVSCRESTYYAITSLGEC